MNKFTVTLTGRTLTARLNSTQAVLFTLQLSRFYSFRVQDATVYHDAPWRVQTNLQFFASPAEAHELVDTITRCLDNSRQQRENRYLTRGLMIASALMALFILVKLETMGPLSPPSWLTVPSEQSVTRNISEPLPSEPLSHQTPLQALPQPLATATPAPVLSPEQAKARQFTAQSLATAAGSGRYTVRLSTGHERTLYVFADPLCHNCRTIEPTLEQLAQHYNIEIFPVTLVGQSDTVKLVSGILCSAVETRLNGWKNLFRADAGMMPGSESVSAAACDAGTQAIAANDRAFDFYKLPGTPSLLSDDGRFIPLSVLRTGASLQAFLNAPAAAGE